MTKSIKTMLTAVILTSVSTLAAHGNGPNDSMGDENSVRYTTTRGSALTPTQQRVERRREALQLMQERRQKEQEFEFRRQALMQQQMMMQMQVYQAQQNYYRNQQMMMAPVVPINGGYPSGPMILTPYGAQKLYGIQTVTPVTVRGGYR